MLTQLEAKINWSVLHVHKYNVTPHICSTTQYVHQLVVLKLNEFQQRKVPQQMMFFNIT